MRWIPVQPQPEGDSAPVVPSRSRLADQVAADIAEALGRAERVFVALLRVLGPGEHALTLTTGSPDSRRVARLRVRADREGCVSYDAPNVLGFWGEIGGGFLEVFPGALVVRTASPDGEESVCAWVVDPCSWWLVPRTGDQTREGYQFGMPEGVRDPEPHLIYRSAAHLSLDQVP